MQGALELMDLLDRHIADLNQQLGDLVAPLSPRMEQLATSGSILLTAGTLQLAEGFIRVQALGPVPVKGLTDPVERLANHALRGEVWDQAVRYSKQVGDKAMGRSAFREGVASFRQALAALPHLLESHDTLAQAIDLRIALEGALLAVGESRQGFAYLCEAEALAATLGDQRRLRRVLTAMIHGFWRKGDSDHALAYGQHALALTAAGGDVHEQARAQGLVGTVYFSLGDYRLAIDVFRRSIASLEGELRHTLHAVMLTSVRSRA
jgi:tetratricopeptide (TPR) repeat protein